jgi:hypothetical protein
MRKIKIKDGLQVKSGTRALLLAVVSSTLIIQASGKTREFKEPSVSQSFLPGRQTAIESPSPGGVWKVVFEDDGRTGYLYALDESDNENPIQEALHIYNVADLRDKERKSTAAVVWASDGQKACLLLNGHPHAVVDFSAKRGYCRTNFPAPGKWKGHDFQWDGRVMEYFKK